MFGKNRPSESSDDLKKRGHILAYTGLLLAAVSVLLSVLFITSWNTSYFDLLWRFIVGQLLIYLAIGAGLLIYKNRKGRAPRHAVRKRIRPVPIARKQDDKIQAEQDTVQELEAFQFAISHEIKTPIRAIDGYARIFLEDYENSLDAEGTDMIKNIRDICKDTIRLVNELMNYAKVTQEGDKKEIIDLRQLIFLVFEEISPGYTENHKVILVFDTHIPCIIGDSMLFKQAVTNLLSNALKFSKDREPATISAGYLSEDGRDIFYIRDNGVGFDMQTSQKLFGLFERMHSADEFEGSGVGLAIVKKIIQKSGGQIRISGEVGKGATVFFLLPPENVLK